MADMTANYRAMTEESKSRRRHNREASADVLCSKGIQFQSRNMGAHLIVEYGGETVDYWPGTGKWIRRDRSCFPYQGRGVFELLKVLRVDQ